MSDPFVAEIRMFGFNFAPNGWAQCNGQILPLAQNTALFALLGTTYGGNGKSTFGLPDLQGASPLQPGQGAGLPLYDLGETGGSPNVTLSQQEMPQHNHQWMVFGNPPPSTLPGPDGNAVFGRSNGGTAYVASLGSNTVKMSPLILSLVGQGLPHNNMMPYLTVNFCIALQGIFPQRP